MKVAIVLIATNAYFVLGIRFIKRFLHYYKGDSRVTFYFFSDTDPHLFLPEGSPVRWYDRSHKYWQDATNSKFQYIVDIEKGLLEHEDYVYYFDADTNIKKPFTEEWFLGDMVAGEHYGNRYFKPLPFDRHPKSKAFVPEDTPLNQTYYYGAFFGGKVDNVLYFCKSLIANQKADKEWGYEPGVNDESYINQWFHFNAPTKVVTTEQFAFEVSDKGGIGDTRQTNLGIDQHKMMMLKYRNELYDFQYGAIKPAK